MRPRLPSRLLVCAILTGILLAGCANPSAPPTATTSPPVPSATRIDHVFLLLLENKGYDASFGASPGSAFLGKTLPAMGRLLPNYYGIGHESLDNYVALVSGQAPNAVTQGDCQTYVDVAPGLPTSDGQAIGQGCVYPPSVKTVGDQLAVKKITWRIYAEDMAASPGSAPTTCRHPALNSQDPWQGATSTDQYATRHVPFVYFHSIIDDALACAQHVVDLGLLRADLDATATTPSYSFIVPDLCSDGHDEPCADGRPGGYASIDKFLAEWVPRIVDSAAFREGGLLVVTFDEAESNADSTACCNEPTGPNTPMPGIEGPGGGRTGAVLVSSCFTAGSKDETPANHYALLRTIEDVFGLAHLGYAGQSGLKDLDLGTCAPKTGP